MQIHPLSEEDSIAAAALRSIVAPMKARFEGTSGRGLFNDIMKRVAVPEGVTFEAATVGGIAGWWAKPAHASPLYANLSGLPPIRIYVGDEEVLLDDSRRYVENAVAAGVDAQLDIWMGMTHGFVTNVGGFNAATQALKASGAFLIERLGNTT
jgi:alpha/beta hydrolase family protein